MLNTILIFWILFLIFIMLLWKVPQWQLKNTKAYIDLKDRIDLENRIRLTFAQIVGGLILLVGLYFTWRSLDIAKEGQITDRFTKAIVQIGDNNLEIRLGGIYALERLAKDSKKDHVQIMEIFTAYIRNHASLQPDNKIDKNNQSDKKPRVDIQAILSVIGRRYHCNEEKDRLILANTNLQGINLDGVNLRRVDLRNSILNEASLKSAYLENAILYNTHFQKAIFWEAELCNTYFNKAFLQNADFSLAKLLRANFEEAHLEESFFQEANLQEATFYKAHLDRAMLYRANLRGALLKDSDLRESDIRETQNLTLEQICQAKTLYNAQLDSTLSMQIEEKYPHLLEKPKEDIEALEAKALKPRLILSKERKK